MQNKLIYINSVAYLGLVIFNFLAIQLPFFGRTPGDVSDLYPNLLTPPDFSFSIWSVIYLLLGIFICQGIILIYQNKDIISTEISSIGFLFLYSCILNICWLLSWQSLHIIWSFIFIFILWIVLIQIAYKIAVIENPKWTYTVPFSCYLAWICVAALANLNVLLIDLGFDFFGLHEATWTGLLIGIGILGTLLVLYLNQDIWFTVVLLWAFFGIYYKNSQITSGDSFVVVMSLLAMFTLTVTGCYVLFKKWQSRETII